MEPTTSAVETADRLARIETKLDIHLSRGDGHESRIKWLETKVNYFIGVVTVVNAVFMLYADRIIGALNGQ